MTHLRNHRTSRQRRRTGTTLALAAATGGLLAAAMAGSPTARADDLTDIVNFSQNVIGLGEADYSVAGTAFSTPGDTNEGLVASFIGFDNIFISPTDYTLLGLTGEATNTDIGNYGPAFTLLLSVLGSSTPAGEEALAANFSSEATTQFTAATTALSGGEYFAAVYDSLAGSYSDILAGEADTLAGLFSLGI